ncbi:hypothetical protein MBRA_50330 (plasmid) [Mycobacterium branderi]|uniref:Transposase n=1 Tax=Mycobacterium branderi TaxID=43348 RepID=A0ABM7KUE1_9MYCO|nr:hypothetical protein MBRA_50330 [Mycobacterium branderi]
MFGRSVTLGITGERSAYLSDEGKSVGDRATATVTRSSENAGPGQVASEPVGACRDEPHVHQPLLVELVNGVHFVKIARPRNEEFPGSW